MKCIDSYDLLSPEDREMEASDQDGVPGLSSALNSDVDWESRNIWRCFSKEEIHIECSELDTGAIHVPTIRLNDGGQLLDFSLDPSPNLACHEVLARWTELLENQRIFCVYASHLQELEYEKSESDGVLDWHLWIISQLKTNSGSWKWNEPTVDSESIEVEAFEGE